MATVFKYSVYCIQEDTYVYTWSETEPTLCPNDHGDRSINSNLTTVIETREIDQILVTENTTGDYTFDTKINSIPLGLIGDVTIHDEAVWPDIDILLWRTIIDPSPEMVGDVINVRGIKGPGVNDNIVGILMSTANVSDTVLTVNSTVIDNVYKGLEVELDDGVTKENVGIITAIDKIGNTITVKNPLINSFAPGTTNIRVEIIIINDFYVNSYNYAYKLGGKGLKGKNISAGDIMRVKYKNNTGLAKNVCWRVEYYNKISGT